MNCVRCTIRRNDGSLEVADLVLAVDPAQWSVDDARDAILAAIRLLESGTIRVLSTPLGG